MTGIVVCTNCEHAKAHNQWGKCSEDGCECRTYAREPAQVVVLRNPDTLRAVAVPAEVVREVDDLYDAYVLYRRGESWEAIAAANTTRWANARAVAEEVKRYIDEGRAVLRGFSARAAIATDIDALRTLQSAYWDAALAGKVPAGQLVRQFIRDRIELYQLLPADPDETAAVDATQGRTLVIGSDSYTEDLVRAAERPGT